MKFGILACCAVILVLFGAFLLAGDTASGLASNLGLLAPLALCLAAHVVLHRMMGKSGHDIATDAPREDDPQRQDVAAVARFDAPR